MKLWVWFISSVRVETCVKKIQMGYADILRSRTGLSKPTVILNRDTETSS